MRLTLRTLIAYLDDVLEPTQIKEIGKKLDESGYASSLVERIKDVLRRRRLTAPEVEGPGSSPDPNMVAEYLDNTLSPESVADVEKICLNSDVNLVEVAASHQILTLVLGEPATINPDTRERIYALGPIPSGNELDVASSNTTTESATIDSQSESQNDSTSLKNSAPANQQTVPAKDPEPFSSRIPDYLKTKPLWKRFTPYFLILLAGVVWAGLFFGDPTFFPELFSGGETSTQLASNIPENPEVNIPVPGDNKLSEPDPTVDQSKPTPSVKPSTPDMTASNKTPAPVAINKPPAFDAPPPADAESGTTAKAVPAVPPVVSNLPPKTAGQPATTPPAVSPDSKTVAMNNTAKTPPSKIELADVPSSAPAAQIESEDGFFLANVANMPDIADKNDWVIHSKVSPIQAGTPVASPEPFTARINIPEAHCKVVLLPDTSVIYAGKSKAAEMGFEIQQGRLRIEASRGLNDAKDAAGPIFSIKVNDELWRIELVTRDSVCGIEIDPVQPTKPDEVLGANGYTGVLYAYSGMIRFSDGKGKVQTVDAGQWMSLSAKDRAASATNPSDRPKPLRVPRWVEPEFKDNSYLSRRSIAAFIKELDDDQLVSLTMPAITKDLKPNISELATKSLALTNRYQALVKVLDEVDHHESRIAAIDGIRNWLPRDPQNGELLKEALNMQFSPEMAEIMERLLWGFQKSDAQDRFISGRLVEWLEHDNVTVRELAFNSIHQLTGRPIDYSGISTPAQRRSTARRWFAHLEKHGSLVAPDAETKPIPATSPNSTEKLD